jgi:hypothetical protein
VEYRNNDDAFLTRLGIPNDQFCVTLLSLRLQCMTHLQGFPDGLSHGRESALLLNALQALETPIIEREDHSLRLCHAASLLSTTSGIANCAWSLYAKDIAFVNKNLSDSISYVTY